MPNAIQPQCTETAVPDFYRVIEDAITIADLGWQAMRRDQHLLARLNIRDGKVTHGTAARDFGFSNTKPDDALH